MTTQERTAWVRHLRRPFWNPDENRIRAFWRIFGALVPVLVLTGLLSATLVQGADFPLAVRSLLSNGIPLVLSLVVLVLWAKYVDKRPIQEYGFRLDTRWWRMLVLGVTVGIFGWGGALATDVALGWAAIESYLSPGEQALPFWVSIGVFGLSWVAVGIWEEILFRGIVMRNAIEGLDISPLSHHQAVVGGWVLSSVFFGVLHLEQAASAVSLLFWVLAGLIMGLAYLLTDELAYPIGLHLAFDLSANNIWGLATLRDVGAEIPTLIRPTFSGPEVYVGLSGWVNTIWLLLIGAITILVVRWEYGGVESRIEPYRRQ